MVIPVNSQMQQYGGKGLAFGNPMLGAVYFNYNTSTTTSSVSSGEIRFNSATPSSVTEIAVSVNSLIATGGTTTNNAADNAFKEMIDTRSYAFLHIIDPLDENGFISYLIRGYELSGSTRKFTVDQDGGSTSFAFPDNGKTLYVFIQPIPAFKKMRAEDFTLANNTTAQNDAVLKVDVPQNWYTYIRGQIYYTHTGFGTLTLGGTSASGLQYSFSLTGSQDCDTSHVLNKGDNCANFTGHLLNNGIVDRTWQLNYTKSISTDSIVIQDMSWIEMTPVLRDDN